MGIRCHPAGGYQAQSQCDRIRRDVADRHRRRRNVAPDGHGETLGLSRDLKPQQCRSAAGTTTVYAPKNLGLVEIDIEGREEWIRLPSLAFANGTYPLLGRDVLFANFELRMTSDEIELRWRSDRK